MIFPPFIEQIQKSDVSFICVPTPTLENKIELCYIEDAVEKIGIALALRQNYHAVVVVKSTVVPKTTENVVIQILEKRI